MELDGLSLGALNLTLEMRLSLASGLNMTELLACASLTAGNGACPDPESARALVAQAQEEMARQYEDAQNFYLETSYEARSYINEAKPKLDDAKLKIEQSARAFREIKGVMDASVPGGFSGFFSALG